MNSAIAALKMFLVVVGLLSLSFTAPGQTEALKTKPGKKYKQMGTKLASPKDADWRLVKSEKMETVFEKVTANKKFKAFVKTAKIPVYETDKELLANLEKLKMAEVDEKNRDSIHFNHIGYKSTPCLQYDGIFNAPDTGYKHFNMSGYICRHPDDSSVIIQFEYANYSNDRGFLETEIQSSISFFEGVGFTKPK